MTRTLARLEIGTTLSGSEIDDAVRLGLREMGVGVLEGGDGFYVQFGYDYSMYVGWVGPEQAPPPAPDGMYFEVFENPYKE
ncbi:hypothetical protein AKJ09_06317 [Labilithrix luteola]|uniref:Uncharacterized protein n=1 Tax=Labilithrix luteola TaxID=1391654 RepID=A0A0K1Q1J9_9BACT|nr:hypothetical protein [Labilithrix luteola]AKU99653.1 hypothetical protein AKJ09_06317 [Labilithrix luteola]